MRATVATTPRPAPRSEAVEVRRYSTAFFQYLGATALTARGPKSGRTYRFAHPGAVVAVDPRDLAALTAVPGLRQVARPG